MLRDRISTPPAARTSTSTNSLVAAATVITGHVLTPGTKPDKLHGWQEKAWRHYDQVGEFRFAVQWLSNGLSRVNLAAASAPTSGAEPAVLSLEDDELTPVQRRAAELVDEFGGGAIGQGQLLFGFGQHLSVSGFAWLLAEPDSSPTLNDNEIGLPDDPTDPASKSDPYTSWKVLPQDAVEIIERKDQTPIIKVTEGTGSNTTRIAHPDALLVACWRQHPHRPWEPDAPVRAVLDILDHLETFGKRITAEGRSRLAGNGLIAFPSEMTLPDPPANEDGTPSEQDGWDYFVEQMIDTWATPIRNPENASAVIPLPIQVPGEWIDKISHLTFSSKFDTATTAMVDQTIRRLALGLDLPPEVLLGKSDVNHWNVWQIAEEAITLHIEPAAEIVCHAAYEGFLKPTLLAEGFSPEDVASVLFWYRTDDLTHPPDKSAAATAAFEAGLISESAYRGYLGLSDDDEPEQDARRTELLLRTARETPTLAPGILRVLGWLTPDEYEILTGLDAGSGSSSAVEAPVADRQPPALEDAPQNNDALLSAMDGVCRRAMERAGSRLRSELGKANGGPQNVMGAAEQLHVEYGLPSGVDLTELLEGGFAWVPDVASRFSVSASSLEAVAQSYCRSLLATGHPHSLERLADALGLEHSH